MSAPVLAPQTPRASRLQMSVSALQQWSIARSPTHVLPQVTPKRAQNSSLCHPSRRGVNRCYKHTRPTARQRSSAKQTNENAVRPRAVAQRGRHWPVSKASLLCQAQLGHRRRTASLPDAAEGDTNTAGLSPCETNLCESGDLALLEASGLGAKTNTRGLRKNKLLLAKIYTAPIQKARCAISH